MNLPSNLNQKYLEAKPYPHIVLDDVFYTKGLHLILFSWPDLKQTVKVHNYVGHNLKGSLDDESLMSSCISGFMQKLNGQEFVKWLCELTGMKGLIPDPFANAITETFINGELLVHTDYTRDGRTGLRHAVIVMAYLNECEGGELELWDASPKENGKCVKSVKPKFNRIVIFNTNEDTWHGQPNPVTSGTRKAIAMNYFVNDGIGLNKIVNNTTFVRTKSKTVKETIQQFVPPIIMERYFKIKNKKTGHNQPVSPKIQIMKNKLF